MTTNNDEVKDNNQTANNTEAQNNNTTKTIPYYRFEEVIAKNNALKEQITKQEQQLNELIKFAKDNDDLKMKLKELQEQADNFKVEYEQKEIQLKKQLALKEALLNEGVTDSEARDLLLLKFDLNKVELNENNKIKNLDELVKPLKTNPSLNLLFGFDKVTGKTPDKSKTTESLLTKGQVERMSEQEVLDNYDLIQKSMLSWNK